MATHNVLNIATGPRGFNAVSGLVDLAPGGKAGGVEIDAGELVVMRSTGWFEIDGSTETAADADDLDTGLAELEAIAAAEGVTLPTEGTGEGGRVLKADIQDAIRAAPPPADDLDDLDDLDDATLLSTVAAVTGKPEADLQGLDRNGLLELARSAA